jgi:hypothetical protein
VLYNKLEIYLDECGDLGIEKERSSKYLVIAATALPETESFIRIIKKAHRKLGVRGKQSIEFKFNTSSLPIRKFFLESIAEVDCWIAWIAFEKQKLRNQLLTAKNEVYLDSCMKVIPNILRYSPSRSVDIIVDRRSNKKSERNIFDARAKSIVDSNHAGYFEPRLRISHFESWKSEGLQVHDFIVGSIFQKIERGNPSYYELIEKKVVFSQLIGK